MSLIIPNQVRVYGNIVYAVPNQFMQVRSLHGTYVPGEVLKFSFVLRFVM